MATESQGRSHIRGSISCRYPASSWAGTGLLPACSNRTHLKGEPSHVAPQVARPGMQLPNLVRGSGFRRHPISARPAEASVIGVWLGGTLVRLGVLTETPASPEEAGSRGRRENRRSCLCTRSFAARTVHVHD